MENGKETTTNDLARMVQSGFLEMHTEFGKVHQRLNDLEDRINYSSQSFSMLMRDLEETKTRVTRLEAKVG